MSKTTGTRKQEAKELIERLELGPAFSFPTLQFYEGETEFSTKIAKRQFDMWCKTWIIPMVKRLVPELKEKIL